MFRVFWRNIFRGINFFKVIEAWIIDLVDKEILHSHSIEDHSSIVQSLILGECREYLWDIHWWVQFDSIIIIIIIIIRFERISEISFGTIHLLLDIFIQFVLILFVICQSGIVLCIGGRVQGIFVIFLGRIQFPF